MKTYRPHIIAILIILIAGFGFWFFNSWGELEKPAIQLDQDITAIGRSKTFNIAFTDRKSGLRNSAVTIVQDNQTQVLSSLNYADAVTKESNVSVTIDPLAMKLHEGPATINISATGQLALEKRDNPCHTGQYRFCTAADISAYLHQQY